MTTEFRVPSAFRAVEIVEKATGVVVKRMPRLGHREAERVFEGANINLNHDDYFVRIVEDEDEDTRDGIMFRVHCFSCGMEYDQRIPRNFVRVVTHRPLIPECGACGSDFIGVGRHPGEDN